MAKQFDVASASITGTTHTKRGQNNQDVAKWARINKGPGLDIVVGVVCDGCGSQPHSEFGANLGAHLAVNTITKALIYGYRDPCAHVKQALCSKIFELAKDMGSNPDSVIASHFLFTMIGFVIWPDTTTIFSMGDGCFYVNGERNVIDPMEGNAPPYLAYNLIDPKKLNIDIPPERLEFSVKKYETETIESLLIGSDGVDYIENAADHNLPGKSEPIGPVSQFWDEDRYFENPANLHRRLFLMNRASAKIDKEKHTLIKENGILFDDTTIIVARAKKEEAQK